MGQRAPHSQPTCLEKGVDYNYVENLRCDSSIRLGCQQDLELASMIMKYTVYNDLPILLNRTSVLMTVTWLIVLDQDQ